MNRNAPIIAHDNDVKLRGEALAEVPVARPPMGRHDLRN